jgi:hypothetical protein
MNRKLGYAALCSTTLLSAPALAVPYFYTDWSAANPAAGTASGSISLPGSTVQVGFSVRQANGAAGSFSFAQTSGGTNYWNPSAPYVSSQVSNAPPNPDIIALIGGSTTTTYTLTLSEPIRDPIMSIVSLGAAGRPITYNFDRPFTVVSTGQGFWGNGPFTQQPGNVLQGAEGHGTIQFLGTFSTFSWTAPVSENWHGFQFGVRTTEALEPGPGPGPGPSPVPEPATLGLLALGLLGTATLRRGRSRS